ncbi:hypothetical protein EI562_04205 [Enterobacter asburiae]|nr:hypothetical protein EI562_04205 [Enterobacter asburiae]
MYSIFALSHIDASGSRLKRGLCVTTLVTRNEGGHSTAIPCNRQSLPLIHKLHLLTHNDINGIYGHSRFCNTDFDDKLACLNLSGV